MQLQLMVISLSFLFSYEKFIPWYEMFQLFYNSLEKKL